MCTLTFLPQTSSGFLLGINRDEDRTRAIASDLCTELTSDGIRMVFPRDPQSDGTWVGMNSNGLVCALLNQHPPEYSPKAKTYRSRGVLVPDVLRSATGRIGIAKLHRLPPQDFPPYLVLVFDDRESEVISFRSNGLVYEEKSSLWAPLLKSSSSFDEKLAFEIRSKAFMDFFSTRSLSKCNKETLLAFHSLVHPKKPEVGVCMERQEARTVSFTMIEVQAGQIRMLYSPKPPNEICSIEEFLTEKWTR